MVSLSMHHRSNCPAEEEGIFLSANGVVLMNRRQNIVRVDKFLIATNNLYWPHFPNWGAKFDPNAFEIYGHCSSGVILLLFTFRRRLAILTFVARWIQS